ncbi:hypothetical protein [Actinoplanes sp. DH11]|uniref:hypothetical protein n=1 Tax=Actinoplanes sp. DH11 TaxID=2857011 RepID=UPI001E5D6161|nr:hypothetical protein [Actinoplanes sp. DH11]
MSAAAIRRAWVREVHTSLGTGLPGPGAAIGYRFRPGGLGAYQHRLETVDGAAAPALLIGFPVRGGRAGEHLRALHEVLKARPGLFPAAAVWHGVLRLPDGRTCHALLAPDPAAEGYRPLHGAPLGDEPPHARFALARALAAAVRDLAAVGAVHGGLDSATLLARTADHSVRIAEVEFASLRRDDTPLAVGAAAGYLAPELYDDLGEHPEPATEAADRWSLAVAAHVVLTGFHPYHFLLDLSLATIGGYAASQTWPQHRLAASAPFAVEYAAALASLPDAVLELFARCFQHGWRDPDARPSAATWLATLTAWTGHPVVTALHADRSCVLAGDTVTVSWHTRFAHRVLVDGVAGGPDGSRAVTVDRPRRIVVRAIGPSGTVEAATPRVEVVRVPPLRLRQVRPPFVLAAHDTPAADRPAPVPLRHLDPPGPPDRRPLPPPRPSVPAPPRPVVPARPGSPDPGRTARTGHTERHRP